MAMKILLVGLSLLFVFVGIYFGMNYLLKGRQDYAEVPSGSPNREGKKASQTPGDGQVKDPVTGQVVDPENAPYHYEYMGRMYYFAGEDSLKEFIKYPVRYSGLRLKVKINVQETPGQETPETPVEVSPQFPDYSTSPDSSTPAEETPEMQMEQTPADTPADTPAENTEPGVETPGDSTPPVTEVEASPGGQSAPPMPEELPDKGSGGGDAAPTEGDGSSMKLPPGAMVQRPRPGKDAPADGGQANGGAGNDDGTDPGLQATPIEPPQEGTQSL